MDDRYPCAFPKLGGEIGKLSCFSSYESLGLDEESFPVEMLKAFFLAGAGGDPDDCRFLLLTGGPKFEGPPRVSDSVKTIHSRWLLMRSFLRKRKCSPTVANPLVDLRPLPSSPCDLFTSFNSSFPLEYSTPAGMTADSSCMALFRLSSSSWMRFI